MKNKHVRYVCDHCNIACRLDRRDPVGAVAQVHVESAGWTGILRVQLDTTHGRLSRSVKTEGSIKPILDDHSLQGRCPGQW